MTADVDVDVAWTAGTDVELTTQLTERLKFPAARLNKQNVLRGRPLVPVERDQRLTLVANLCHEIQPTSIQ